jgi:hypothetical protein
LILEWYAPNVPGRAAIEEAERRIRDAQRALEMARRLERIQKAAAIRDAAFGLSVDWSGRCWRSGRFCREIKELEKARTELLETLKGKQRALAKLLTGVTNSA